MRNGRAHNRCAGDGRERRHLRRGRWRENRGLGGTRGRGDLREDTGRVAKVVWPKLVGVIERQGRGRLGSS